MNCGLHKTLFQGGSCCDAPDTKEVTLDTNMDIKLRARYAKYEDSEVEIFHEDWSGTFYVKTPISANEFAIRELMWHSATVAEIMYFRDNQQVDAESGEFEASPHSEWLVPEGKEAPFPVRNETRDTDTYYFQHVVPTFYSICTSLAPNPCIYGVWMGIHIMDINETLLTLKGTEFTLIDGVTNEVKLVSFRLPNGSSPSNAITITLPRVNQSDIPDDKLWTFINRWPDPSYEPGFVPPQPPNPDVDREGYLEWRATYADLFNYTKA
jgi:hypothetical protein